MKRPYWDVWWVVKIKIQCMRSVGTLGETKYTIF